MSGHASREIRTISVHDVEYARGDAGPGGAQSVDRALLLVSLISRHVDHGAALSQLVAESRLNKATVRRLVLALMRAGLVEQDSRTRRYHLGREAYVLGTLAARRHGLLEIALPALSRLARKTEDTALLSIRRGATAVCLHREEGAYPIRTHALQAGDVHPLGVGAGSLAILAALPDDEVEAVVDANAAALQQSYPSVSPEALRRSVAEAREAGYALNPGLVYRDSWGIGMTLRDPGGNVAGALSVAAIESRMQLPRRAQLAELLRQEVAAVEKLLAQATPARGNCKERNER